MFLPFADTESPSLGWCGWTLLGLMAFVALMVLLRRLVVGSTVRAIEYARFLAQTGNFPAAEYALRSALDDLARSPRGHSPVGQHDRQLLMAALRTLQRNPEAFVSGAILNGWGDNFHSQHLDSGPGQVVEPPSPFGMARIPIEQALDTAQLGDLPGACRILEAALPGYPPADQCTGEVGAARFRIQMLLAHYVRKLNDDREREYQLLSEVEPLQQYLPPDPPGDDTVFNTRYLFRMNLGVAAFCTNRYDQAVSAILEALAVARDPQTRCKCLAYLGDYALHQGEAEWRDEARRSFDQFDQEAAGHNISHGLRALVLQGRAVLALHAGDAGSARALLEQALDADSIPAHARALEMLRQPGPDLPQVIESILFPTLPKPTSPSPSRPLPPLSPEFSIVPPVFAPPTTGTPSDEFARLTARVHALDHLGHYEEMEAVARKALALANDEQRGELLAGLARAQMRQGRITEALQTSLQAVHFSHRKGDAIGLIDFLDTHAEIRSRNGDYAGSLRTLQEARRFALAAEIDNPLLNARLAQTWGTSYKGCGQWEQSARSLRQALHFYEHQRRWDEWSLVVGELVKFGIEQADSEGPDLALIRELRELLERASPRLERNPTFRLMAIHDRLQLRERLAIAGRDWSELHRVREEYARLMATEGEGLRDHFSVLVENTVGASRLDRTLIDHSQLDAHESRLRLDGQASLYTKALTQAPKTLDLWRERAALHLCRARHGLESPAEAARAAAACLETAMDLQGEDSADFSTAEVRAGWLGRFNGLGEDLLETASFALHEVQPQESATAVRLLELSQSLRARSRRDIVRSLGSLQPPSAADRASMADLLARIRALHRWLERLAAVGHRSPERSGRAMTLLTPAVEPSPGIDLTRVVAECENVYPEYRYLETRGQIEAELARRKRQMEQLSSRNVSVRSSTTQALDEEPFDLEAWRTQLPPGEVVLDYNLGPSRAQVILYARDQTRLFRLPFAGLRPLRLLVRDALSPPESSNEPALAALANGMHTCGDWLLPEAVVSVLREAEATRVWVVASGPLWGVPFGWLRAGDRLALQRWEIVLVPSLRLAGGGEVAPVSLRAAAVGHPGDPPTLPKVGDEVKLVVDLFGGQSLEREQATAGRVLDEVCPQSDILHIACHAEADPVVPWLSCLHLGKDERHPDGRLMLYEVLGVPMNALVVNTAACHTARAEGPMSFPESLAHAFLGAGARFVIASLWAANDDECLAFAGDFYRELLSHREVPRAFRAAQTRQVERLGANVSPEGLYRCANFVLLGSRGRSEVQEKRE